ncbi:DUF4381 domain-containing protein [Legionella brunensis]|uniref:Transmembrane protein n=1 Tax=Legionella brunensis TaxID=29422 RepID=A0A0W0S0Z0_9GAMM|nr:DUF4381 domain-containing protein [Legionella brunensis]KTC76984.1 hypothetical protein Lbru_3091 [Legionella brunensis]
MADSQLLNQLHDIQLPEPIGWWPLAPGWYVLLVALLVVGGSLFYIAYRRYKHGRAKREALHLLINLQKEYERDHDSQLSSMKISELLRRVALVYFPRQQVASLQGQEWIEFLSKTAKGINFDQMQDYLLQLPYQKPTDIDLSPLFNCAKSWIKQRGVPCSN